MIRRVISGGQTGADMAGLLAARECGIETGGIAPRGYRTENGFNLQLKEFGLKESASSAYPPRTQANITNSDLTLIISPKSPLIGGSALTKQLCLNHRKPYYHIRFGEDGFYKNLNSAVEWVHFRKHDTINIAGSRGSHYPWLEAAAMKVLVLIFNRVNARVQS